MNAFDVAGGELATWDAVYQAYSAYGACDDGAIGEGFSDSVVKLLARRWDNLEILETSMGRNEDFREFVYRHIDATTDEEDLRAIVVSAESCAPAFKKTCERIGTRAWQALQSM